MHGLQIEQRTPGLTPLYRDIALHMHADSPHGGIAIVAKHPAQIHAGLKRQWHELTRKRSGVVANTQVRSLHFSANPLHDQAETDVAIATADEFLLAPPTCRVMYVTYPVDDITLRCITGFMPEHSLVVLYRGTAYA